MLNKNKIKTSLIAFASLLLPFAVVPQVFASGDVSLSFSPASGNYMVGSTLSLSVRTVSQVSDNVAGVDIHLSYPSNLLSAATPTSSFSLCTALTAGGGSAEISCASTSPVSGTTTWGTINFTVLAAGTATVNVTAGSQVEDSSTNDVYDGVQPSASYTLSTPATQNSGGGTGGSAKGSSNNSGTKTDTATPATTTTPQKQSATAPTTTTPTTTQAPKPTGKLSVTVTSSDGKPVKGAKVTLETGDSAITDDKGVANFDKVIIGSHTATISASGRATSKAPVSIAENQTYTLNINLAAKTSSVPILVAVGAAAVVVIVGAGSFIYVKSSGFSFKSTIPAPAGMVVGSAGAPPEQVTPSNPNVPKPPTPTPPSTPPTPSAGSV